MISGPAREGCVKILQMIDAEDLLAIKDTVTNKQIATLTLNEAMNAILSCSLSEEELLNRRKIKREILFEYMYKERVPNINAADTKSQLISKITKFWKRNERNLYVEKLKVEESTERIPQRQNSIPQRQNSSITGQKLAEEFIHWFYPMLNGLADTSEEASMTRNWGPQNFWPDANLSIMVITDVNNQREEKYFGAEAVHEKFASMIVEDHALLNVNDTPEGYRGIISQHGLAKVAACGTLHRISKDRIALQGACNSPDMVGIFEQSFGLLRDPMDGNRWKIKLSDLKIKLTSASQQPGQLVKISLSVEIIKSISSD